MGYQTDYILEASQSSVLEEIAYYLDKEDILYMEIRDGKGRCSCKWYDHSEDMEEISKKYPKVLFTLTGYGEESGDIWRKYFKNGKRQIAKTDIVFENFDESKLV